MSRRPLRFALASLALAVLTSGCGYVPGYLTPPSVATIAVPVFDNQTFPLRREIELELTDAFRREIQTRTHLVLVDHKSVADMIVHGTVKRFRERVDDEGRFDEKTESTIYVDVEMVVDDLRNGKTRIEELRVSEPLSIQRGETLDVARRRAIDNLAERMLTALEFWGE